MSEMPRDGSSPQPDGERAAVAQAAGGQLQISAVQVVASSLAAVSAAVLCSFAGVAGTIVGTAVASACATIGSALYAHSLRRTRERLRNVPALRHPGAATQLWRHTEARSNRLRPDPGAPPTPEPAEVRDSDLDATPLTLLDRLQALPWRKVALASVGVFVLSAAVITVIELGAGSSLGSMIGGSGGRSPTFAPGTSQQQKPGPPHQPGRTASPTSSPTPTPTATVTSPPASPTTESPPASSGESSPPPTTPGGVVSSLLTPNQ